MEPEPQPAEGVVDILTLRFDGTEKDGSALHELRAAHVAEVLQGIVGLSSDFARAGVFGEGPTGSEVLVRPPQPGSFVIEILRLVADHQVTDAVGAVLGIPTLSKIIWWATREARADVSNFEHLENGNVKITWQDNTAEEVPRVAWEELQKRDRRRKKQLRQIMAPLSDSRVSAVEVQSSPPRELEVGADAENFTLTRADYDAVSPDVGIDERQQTFETEAQMSAIDFDNPTRWRVKTRDATRAVTVEDQEFLGRIAGGLPIRKSDIFRLQIREKVVTKNGQTRRTWTVLKVESFRRAAHDSDT